MIATSSLEELFTIRGFRPKADFVAVKRVPAEKRSRSGLLIIPDSVAEKYRAYEGIVVAVGPGRRNSKGILSVLQAKPGDHVVFNRYSAAESALMDPDFWLIRDYELAGVIESELTAP